MLIPILYLSIIHRIKKTGITYVYSSESYWDKDLKAPRNRKKLIGKIDKETGEIVPTGKRGRKPKNAACSQEGTDYKALYEEAKEQLLQKEQDIQALRSELSELKASMKQADQRLEKIRSILK